MSSYELLWVKVIDHFLSMCCRCFQCFCQDFQTGGVLAKVGGVSWSGICTEFYIPGVLCTLFPPTLEIFEFFPHI